MLAAWCAARPQPRMQLNMNSVASATKFAFYQANFRRPRPDRKYFQGPYHEDIFRIWKEYLMRPNGECNLGLAYPTIAAIVRAKDEEPWLLPKYEAVFRQYQALVDAALARKHLSPDARMTWLVASAAGKESFLRFLPAASYALPDLETALTTSAEQGIPILGTAGTGHTSLCHWRGRKPRAGVLLTRRRRSSTRRRRPRRSRCGDGFGNMSEDIKTPTRTNRNWNLSRRTSRKSKRRLQVAKDNSDQENVERLEGIIAACEKKRLEPLQAGLAAQQSEIPNCSV